MFLLLLACDRTVHDVEAEVCSDDLGFAPGVTESSLGPIAPVDLLTTEATVGFTDTGISIQAITTLLTSRHEGSYALELLPAPSTVTLDGAPISLQRVLVGDPAREVVIFDTPLEPCSEHTLAVAYDLPFDWAAGDQARLHELPEGTFFSAGLEDASAGNFLSLWLPSNLLFDRFDLTVEFELPPGHSLVSTGSDTGATAHWEHIQAHTPFWVVAPDTAVVSTTSIAQTAERAVTVEVYALASDDQARLDEGAARGAAAIELFSELFGPYHHGDRYIVWVRSDQNGSMEYDGATQTRMGAIEHEIMHSWYARGTSPRTDSDGWIDEAITSWVTDLFPFRANAVRYELTPTRLRFGADGWDGPQLDIEQYVYGSAIFADIAYRYSVEEVIQALGAFYVARVGDSYRDVDIEEHLTCWFDAEVRDAFFHQAYGAGPAPPVPAAWCGGSP